MSETTTEAQAVNLLSQIRSLLCGEELTIARKDGTPLSMGDQIAIGRVMRDIDKALHI